MEKRPVRIVKGVLVVMKARKVSNLYVLIGNTITGGATMSLVTYPNLDSTRLRHMCMGHMSERGLT